MSATRHHRPPVELAGLLGGADRAIVIVVMADEQAGPDQTHALRQMSPAERWRVAHRLYWTMRRHKTAFLRAQHPDWSEQRVSEQVRRNFQHAGA